MTIHLYFDVKVKKGRLIKENESALFLDVSLNIGYNSFDVISLICVSNTKILFSFMLFAGKAITSKHFLI